MTTCRPRAPAQRLMGVVVQEVGTRSTPASEMVLKSFLAWEREIRKELTEPAWEVKTNITGFALKIDQECVFLEWEETGFACRFNNVDISIHSTATVFCSCAGKILLLLRSTSCWCSPETRVFGVGCCVIGLFIILSVVFFVGGGVDSR